MIALNLILFMSILGANENAKHTGQPDRALRARLCQPSQIPNTLAHNRQGK